MWLLGIQTDPDQIVRFPVGMVIVAFAAVAPEKVLGASVLRRDSMCSEDAELPRLIVSVIQFNAIPCDMKRNENRIKLGDRKSVV